MASTPCAVLDEQIHLKEDVASVGTMHFAKSLEFRVVAVLACDEGVLPLSERIEQAGNESDINTILKTERHLFYIACTHARDALFESVHIYIFIS
jgi:superfamily I DNA/RNA helicase